MASTQTSVATPIEGEARVAHELERELVREASVELTPRQVAAVDDLSAHLPLGTRVYMPSIPGSAWRETVAACERLHRDGMVAVPHLGARSIANHAELASRLNGLAATRVSELMLIAGDRKRPAGMFRDTLDILDSGALVEHGLVRVGIAGYPEGHPVADPAALARSLSRKLEYAAATGTEMWMVSQFSFDPRKVVSWLDAIRRTSERLPVRVGMAGPARLKTVLAFAARCGVRASARALARRPSALRLLNNWTPDSMLQALARHRMESPDSTLSGIHLFTFGGLPQTSRWLRATAGIGTAPLAGPLWNRGELLLGSASDASTRENSRCEFSGRPRSGRVHDVKAHGEL